MNFSKIKLIKSGKHISVFNDKMEKIHFKEHLLTHFGNERNDNVDYINWEINDKLSDILQKIEIDFCNYMKVEFNIGSGWQWKTSVRPQLTFVFLRTTNSSKMIVNKNAQYDVKIVLDSIWVNKQTKTFGILWTC